jgi:hypothetical protein
MLASTQLKDLRRLNIWHQLPFHPHGNPRSYIARVLGTNPISYWPLAEPSGSDAFCYVLAAQKGTHTGVTLGQPGIGGKTCPYYDGANDYTNIQTATFAGRFNGAEGSLMIWVKVANAGVWTDGTLRYLARVYVDANNEVVIWKAGAANNTLYLRHRANGVDKTVSANDFTTTDWYQLLLTWSATADQFKAYRNAAQLGATQTGLGVWAGTPTFSLIGAQTSGPISVWHGYAAHVPIWAEPLPLATVQDLYRP